MNFDARAPRNRTSPNSMSQRFGHYSEIVSPSLNCRACRGFLMDDPTVTPMISPSPFSHTVSDARGFRDRCFVVDVCRIRWFPRVAIVVDVIFRCRLAYRGRNCLSSPMRSYRRRQDRFVTKVVRLRLITCDATLMSRNSWFSIQAFATERCSGQRLRGETSSSTVLPS